MQNVAVARDMAPKHRKGNTPSSATSSLHRPGNTCSVSLGLEHIAPVGYAEDLAHVGSYTGEVLSSSSAEKRTTLP